MTRPSKTRTVIKTYGEPRDRDYVRVYRQVFRNGATEIRVEWKEPKRVTRGGWDDTRAGIAAAQAYGKGKHDALKSRGAEKRFAPVTVRGLFARYVDANEADWRPATLIGKQNHWRLLELFVGRNVDATTVTPETLARLKKSLIQSRPKDGGRLKSINQVRATLNTVVAVYRWAIDADVLPPSKLVNYTVKFAKDLKKQVITTEEYTPEERERIVGAMSPLDSRNWRVWALTELFRFCGPRKNAALSLEWPNVDFDGNRILWAAETDKQGEERWQPMPPQVRDALLVAYGWALAFGYAGRWVFFRPGAGLRDRANGGYVTARTKARAERTKDLPYTYSAYNGSLHRYEKRAGLDPVPFKASHAFRRGIATDVHDATGSTRDAADWIGDKSVKVVDRHYIKTRTDKMEKLAGIASATARNSDSPETEARTGNPTTEGLTE